MNDFLGVEKGDWKERWGDVVEFDHDYDGEFLLKLLCRKLELMLNYYTKIKNKIEKGTKYTSNDIDKILKSLQKCLDLNKKVLDYNYGAEADDLFDKAGNLSWLAGSSEESDYVKWVELTEKAVSEREKDIEKLFNLVGKNVNSWWL